MNSPYMNTIYIQDLRHVKIPSPTNLDVIGNSGIVIYLFGSFDNNVILMLNADTDEVFVYWKIIFDNKNQLHQEIFGKVLQYVEQIVISGCLADAQRPLPSTTDLPCLDWKKENDKKILK